MISAISAFDIAGQLIRCAVALRFLFFLKLLIRFDTTILVDRDDRFASFVHGQPYGHFGIGPTGGRNLRFGLGGEPQSNVAGYAAYCGSDGQAGQSQGG